MQARETRSQLGWLEKRLGTGGAKTRALYAWSRRLRHRKELALRRGSLIERHESPRSRFRSRALCAMRFTLPSAFSAPSDPASRAPLHHLATPDMSPVERLVLGTID